MLEQGNLWIRARILADVVREEHKWGVLAFGGDLKQHTGTCTGVGGCCSIELAVGRLYQASAQLHPHPVVIETVENGETSRRGHLVNSANTARSAPVGCAVEISVTGLNDRTQSVLPVWCALEAVEHGEFALRRDFEHAA